MKKEYLTITTIAAPPERVWAVLTNGAAYAEWNPEIIDVEGVMAPNARIKVKVRLGDGAVRQLSQRVAVLEPLQRMEWVGGLPFGLFVGRRTFTLSPARAGTEFRMHLDMSGPLARMILKSVGDRQPEIEKFSAALKRRAEARGS